MRKMGCCRVSSTHQNQDPQLGALRAEHVDVIFREKASSRSVKGRPELDKAIDELGTGDILVVAEWDRATRSMFDGIHL
jgi:DNA invertase Pin-like site-specific DNA recombinase